LGTRSPTAKRKGEKKGGSKLGSSAQIEEQRLLFPARRKELQNTKLRFEKEGEKKGGGKGHPDSFPVHVVQRKKKGERRGGHNRAR